MTKDLNLTLINEKLDHMSDVFDQRFSGLENLFSSEIKLSTLRLDILEELYKDHEERIRSNRDEAVRFKFFSSIYSGGSALAALTALVKSFFGSS